MIIDGRMPTQEEAQTHRHERLAAEDAASPTGANDLRVDAIAAQLEEIEQQRRDDHRIERFEQD